MTGDLWLVNRALVVALNCTSGRRGRAGPYAGERPVSRPKGTAMAKYKVVQERTDAKDER